MIDVRGAPGRGRGLFATRRIHPGTIIARVPYIVVHDPGDLWGHCTMTEHGRVHLMVGLPVFTNHGVPENAELYHDKKEYVLRAVRRIEKDAEILIDYGTEAKAEWS